MEDGLGPLKDYLKEYSSVLILVVVEDGLGQLRDLSPYSILLSLNPCCDGRWSRTYLYNVIIVLMNILS